LFFFTKTLICKLACLQSLLGFADLCFLKKNTGKPGISNYFMVLAPVLRSAEDAREYFIFVLQK
jgi:hypothetical protein